MAELITPKDVIKIVESTINFLDINLVEDNLSPSSEMERQETVDRLYKLIENLHAVSSFTSHTSTSEPTKNNKSKDQHTSNKLPCAKVVNPQSPVVDTCVSKLKVLTKCPFVELKEHAEYYGVLRKYKKQLISKWNRRICILRDGILLYFQSETDTRGKGYIVLGGYKLVIPPSSNGFTFNLESCDHSTVYTFQADQKKEITIWKEHLTKWVDKEYSEHDLQTIESIMKEAGGSAEDDGLVDGEDYGDVASLTTHGEVLVPEPSGPVVNETTSIRDSSASQEHEEYGDVPDQPDEFSKENIYIGAYQCHSDSPQDLSFKRGDVMYILEKIDMYWWLAFLNGKVGLVPSNFLSEAFAS